MPSQRELLLIDREWLDEVKDTIVLGFNTMSDFIKRDLDDEEASEQLADHFQRLAELLEEPPRYHK